MADGSQAFAAQLPPHNLQVEQALVGMVLSDNQVVDRVDWLVDAVFYDPLLRRLFSKAVAVVRRGQLAEPLLLAESFKADPAFVEMGELSYLAMLVDTAPPASYAVEYAKQLRSLHRQREALRIGQDLAMEAAKPSDQDEVEACIEQAEQNLFQLSETGQVNTGLITFQQALQGAIDMTAEAFARDGGLTGTATDLIDLDQKIGGLHPSDLIVLAGRPSMGKTALATNIAFNIARKYAYQILPDGTRKTVSGGIVAFYSLEMSAEQLALRILADASGVSGDRIRKGEIDASEFGRIRDAALELQEAPLYIDATGGISVAKLAARARRLKRQVGLDLIVVDYLQLVTADVSSSQSNRVQEVTQITMGLKALAKELSCPVLALSQLSRKTEEREDKRPQLADLRESGSIEQDADMVWFVYREAYYLGRAEPREGTPEHLTWLEEMDRLEHLAEVIIAKQRHGPIGTVHLSFDSDTTRFGNLARERFYAPRHAD